jgi:nitrile hydratase
MGIEPRFTPGTPVRVANRQPRGHCRTPFYLRGHRGVVESYAGHFHDPTQLAQHRPGLPKLFLYRVRFPHLGPDGQPTRDEIEADIYEDWLESEATP